MLNKWRTAFRATSSINGRTAAAGAGGGWLYRLSPLASRFQTITVETNNAEGQLEVWIKSFFKLWTLLCKLKLQVTTRLKDRNTLEVELSPALSLQEENTATLKSQPVIGPVVSGFHGYRHDVQLHVRNLIFLRDLFSHKQTNNPSSFSSCLSRTNPTYEDSQEVNPLWPLSLSPLPFSISVSLSLSAIKPSISPPLSLILCSLSLPASRLHVISENPNSLKALLAGPESGRCQGFHKNTVQYVTNEQTRRCYKSESTFSKRHYSSGEWSEITGAYMVFSLCREPQSSAPLTLPSRSQSCTVQRTRPQMSFKIKKLIRTKPENVKKQRMNQETPSEISVDSFFSLRQNFKSHLMVFIRRRKTLDLRPDKVTLTKILSVSSAAASLWHRNRFHSATVWNLFKFARHFLHRCWCNPPLWRFLTWKICRKFWVSLVLMD